jgi:hypothetical protein
MAEYQLHVLNTRSDVELTFSRFRNGPGGVGRVRGGAAIAERQLYALQTRSDVKLAYTMFCKSRRVTGRAR